MNAPMFAKPAVRHIRFGVAAMELWPVGMQTQVFHIACAIYLKHSAFEVVGGHHLVAPVGYASWAP